MNDGYNTYLGKAYRFLTYDGLFQTIKNSSLRLTRVDKFNDPLDNNPYIAPLDWNDCNRLGGLQFQEVFNEYVFNKAFKSLFVCCFCKDYRTDDSYLMWSHYGQSHSQVCFEIDFSVYRLLGNPSSVLYPDSLVSERERVNTLRNEDKGLFVVTNKLKQWAYENEVRLIVDIKHPKIDFSEFTLSEDNQYLFADFDLGYISKVIFGVKSELFNELKTIALFKERNLKPQFEKMYIDPMDLKLKSKSFEFK